LLLFLRSDEGEGVPDGVDASGPADPMDVILGGVRHVVVDHVRDSFDVEPARRDVGGDQNLHPPAPQVSEGALALALAAIAVQRGNRMPTALEIASKLVRAVLRPGEHDHAAHLGLR